MSPCSLRRRSMQAQRRCAMNSNQDSRHQHDAASSELSVGRVGSGRVLHYSETRGRRVFGRVRARVWVEPRLGLDPIAAGPDPNPGRRCDPSRGQRRSPDPAGLESGHESGSDSGPSSGSGVACRRLTGSKSGESGSRSGSRSGSQCTRSPGRHSQHQQPRSCAPASL